MRRIAICLAALVAMATASSAIEFFNTRDSRLMYQAGFAYIHFCLYDHDYTSQLVYVKSRLMVRGIELDDDTLAYVNANQGDFNAALAKMQRDGLDLDTNLCQPMAKF